MQVYGWNEEGQIADLSTSEQDYPMPKWDAWYGENDASEPLNSDAKDAPSFTLEKGNSAIDNGAEPIDRNEDDRQW